MRIKWDNGNKTLDICWCNNTQSFQYTKTTVAADPFIDDIYYVNRNIGRLFIGYTNWNYNKICHIVLRSDKMFKKTAYADDVASLQNVLKWLSSTDDNYKTINVPVSFAVETCFDPDGTEYNQYYITASKEWLKKNNLMCLIDPLFSTLNRDIIIANEHKFPKYNKYKKEIIYI